MCTGAEVALLTIGTASTAYSIEKANDPDLPKPDVPPTPLPDAAAADTEIETLRRDDRENKLNRMGVNYFRTTTPNRNLITR